MAHLQYMPGDARLVDQLVYELKSKGIFDQFRKECIADVDTRPAYQNLRQRVESSVGTFLSRQVWKPDLNKNQLREKLRKHILDGNYLEQGVERIVDQVVNPKVASVFIPQVEDVVYNYLGITRKKSVPAAESSNEKPSAQDLLPTDLEAVSPGSVKSNDDKDEVMEIDNDTKTAEDSKMEVDQDEKSKELKENSTAQTAYKSDDTQTSGINDVTFQDSDISIDKSNIPLPSEEIKLESIPPPENSPPKVELEKIELPKDLKSTDIPLPDELPKDEKDVFKPIISDNDDSSSDSSLRRNMSPLTPVRNFNNENSYDAQQAFENDSGDNKSELKEPSTFRFTIESKSTENSSDAVKIEKAEKKDESNLVYQFNNQININSFNTPLYEDSSNSNNLQIDYESDANSKTNIETKTSEVDQNSRESKKDSKEEKDKKSSHKSSHRSRDSHRYSSSSKDRRSDSKHSSSHDRKDSKDKKSSKEDKPKSSHTERSRNRSDKKDSRDSSKHSTSHRGSKDSKDSTHKDSKSHKSSSSSKHSGSSKQSDDKKSSSSSNKDKPEKSSDKSSKDHKSSRDSKSHRSDKDRKSSSSSSSKSKGEGKEREKKEKKEKDDHYSVSGRGNHNRRSTDRDSNDGSSSSKGSNNQPNSKTSENKKENKGSNSKLENTSSCSDSTSPSDKDHVVNEVKTASSSQPAVKPIVRVDTHLETPFSPPPRLSFVPDVTLKKPKIAANLEEAKRFMKMRKFLDEEQKRMNQEAALLLEFQANVRPSLSQVYSSIPGPELEFACENHMVSTPQTVVDNEVRSASQITVQNNDEQSVSNLLVENKETVSTLQTTVFEVQSNETEPLSVINENNIQASQVVLEIDEGQLVQAENNAIESDLQLVTDNSESELNPKLNMVQENKHETKLSDVGNKQTLYETLEQQIESMDKNNVVTGICPNDEEISTEIFGINDNSNADNSSIIEKGETKLNTRVERSEVTKDKEPNVVIQNIEANTNHAEYFEITIITEKLSESDDDDGDSIITKSLQSNYNEISQTQTLHDENVLEYFGEEEKYNAELEKEKFCQFFKTFSTNTCTNKLYVLNCDPYEENLIKEASANFGQFEIVNYHKNGHFKLAKNIVKDVNLTTEITLPIEKADLHETDPYVSNSAMFSPVKSDCSFDLSSDYAAKLEEMVNKTSRQEIMEIILGGYMQDDSPTKMPKIGYCTESNIESDAENTLKRKFSDVDSSENNNRKILTPNKIRKLSESDHISSTTEEKEEITDINKISNNTRSRYLGKARRVGLFRPPRKSTLPNSPSSDKSVENYDNNGQVKSTTPNGKMRSTQRSKVQRYDTSDLYKPKLHYLSRRNNIS